MQAHEEGWKHPTRPEPVSKKTNLSPTLIGFAVVAILALVFVLQNRERTEIHFLFLDHFGRQWVNLLIAMAVGVLLDRLFTLWWRRRKRESKA